MDENKFFKFIWRINGLLIFSIAALSLILLTFTLYHEFNRATGERNVHSVVNVDEEQEVENRWVFGQISTLQDTPYIILPLYSNQEYDQTYFSKSARSNRNYLYINTLTENKNWLYDHNRFLISDRETLKIKKVDSEKDQKTPIAHLFQVIENDTNADGRLNTKDKLNIVLTHIDGTNRQNILSNIDDFLGHTLNDNNELVALYSKDNATFSVRINLETFKISSQTEVKKP